jgi:hypothetical protein
LLCLIRTFRHDASCTTGPAHRNQSAYSRRAALLAQVRGAVLLTRCLHCCVVPALARVCGAPVLRLLCRLSPYTTTHASINRIGANLWRCLGATAIAYCHASASAGDDHDDGGLDVTVRSDFSPMLADLVILADLLRRTDPVRFQVRQPGRP